MDTSREAKSARRTSVLLSLGAAAILMVMFRTTMIRSTAVNPVFGTQHWPAFFRSFLPLDYLAAAGYFTLTMLLMFKGTPKSDSLKSTVKMVLGFMIAFGCMGGTMAACAFGWGISLMAFGFFFVIGTLMMICLGGFIGGVFGLGWSITYGCKALWPRLRGTAFGRMLTGIGTYLSGGK